uniref:Uncharacterized protein n=1 Tax=Tetraselmis sp. GSL018 TaxID=582737 RepID=A0A061RQF9_9CHLO
MELRISVLVTMYVLLSLAFPWALLSGPPTGGAAARCCGNRRATEVATPGDHMGSGRRELPSLGDTSHPSARCPAARGAPAGIRQLGCAARVLRARAEPRQTGGARGRRARSPGSSPCPSPPAAPRDGPLPAEPPTPRTATRAASTCRTWAARASGGGSAPGPGRSGSRGCSQAGSWCSPAPGCAWR